MQLDFNSIKLMKLTKCKRVGRKVNLGLGLNGDPNSPFHFINHPVHQSISISFTRLSFQEGLRLQKGQQTAALQYPQSSEIGASYIVEL